MQTEFWSEIEESKCGTLVQCLKARHKIGRAVLIELLKFDGFERGAALKKVAKLCWCAVVLVQHSRPYAERHVRQKMCFSDRCSRGYDRVSVAADGTKRLERLGRKPEKVVECHNVEPQEISWLLMSRLPAGRAGSTSDDISFTCDMSVLHLRLRLPRFNDSNFSAHDHTLQQ
jgi:hypothetical protein